MSMKLSNFRLSDSIIDLNQIIQLRWVNDEKLADINIGVIKNTFPKINVNYNKKIEKAWKNLKYRAKSNSHPLPNGKVLYWEGILGKENKIKINVSRGLDYKIVTSIRSNDKLYSELEVNNRPFAFVIVSVLLTKDNKLILGKREFYGDWPMQTYEIPGAFIHEKDLNVNSLVRISQKKVKDDYGEIGKIKSIPFAIYKFPRILETVLLCIAKTSVSSEDLKSKKYSEIFSIENNLKDLGKLIKMPLKYFHPPSRVALQLYYENFHKANKLMAGLT